jgi:hypothetical protein
MIGKTFAVLAILVALGMSACQQPTTSPTSPTSPVLKITNNSLYPIVVRFGNYATKTGNEPATASIAPGASLDYTGAPVGSDFNIWYLYSDSTTNWTVRLVDSASASVYVFHFDNGLQYKLVINASNFEYYRGSTTIVGPGTSGTSSTSTTPSPSVTTAVDAPVISVVDAASTALANGGSGKAPFMVTMTCTTAGAQIHYTTDGTTPSYYSPLYSTPLARSTDTTINAKAYTDWSTGSALASFAFATIKTAWTPSISAADSSSLAVYSGSTSWNSITVSMTTATAGGVIRYTLDGSDPTASSTQYLSSFSLSASATVKVATFAASMNTSAISTATYYVYLPQISGLSHVTAMARTNGSIVYAVDYKSAQLYKIDAAAQTVSLAATLPYANPTDIKYSAADGNLYISYRYRGVLSRYSVASGSFLSEFTFSSTAGTTAAVDLALSDATNRIFVLVPDPADSYAGRVAILDKSTGVVRLAPQTTIMEANIMALTPDGQRLFLAPKGLSAPPITAYSTASDKLTLQSYPAALPYGSNGRSFAISPDGTSLTYFCGGGNGTGGYVVYDYSPLTMAQNGAWNIGAYPTYGTFSPDSSMFYAVNGGSAQDSGILRVYSRSSYQLSRDLAFPFFDGQYCAIEATADNAGVVVFTDDASFGIGKPHFWFLSNVR